MITCKSNMGKCKHIGCDLICNVCEDLNMFELDLKPLEHSVVATGELYTDDVKKPKHYTAGKYEVIEIIKEVTNSMELTQYQGYCLGNIIKYVCRFKLKGTPIKDLNKAKEYIDFLIKDLEE